MCLQGRLTPVTEFHIWVLGIFLCKESERHMDYPEKLVMVAKCLIMWTRMLVIYRCKLQERNELKFAQCIGSLCNSVPMKWTACPTRDLSSPQLVSLSCYWCPVVVINLLTLRHASKSNFVQVIMKMTNNSLRACIEIFKWALKFN